MQLNFITALSLWIPNHLAPWFSGWKAGCSRISHRRTVVGRQPVTDLPASRALSSLRCAQVHAFRVKEGNVILNVKIFLAMALYNFVRRDYSPLWRFWMQVFGQSVHEDENCLFRASAFALEHTERIHLKNTVYIKCDMTLKFNWQQTLYRKSWRIQWFHFRS
jgi:hypothetical protein